MPRQNATLAISIMLTAFLMPVPVAAQQNAGADAAESADAASGYRFAEDYRDLQVVNAVGDISRLIIRSDRVTHAVVSIGGVVGLGGSDVVLPFDVFRFEGDRATIDTLASADQIERLTLFDPAAFGLSE